MNLKTCKALRRVMRSRDKDPNEREYVRTGAAGTITLAPHCGRRAYHILKRIGARKVAPA